MIPAYWYSALPAYLWQVFLHSFVMAVVFLLWSRTLGLPSGKTRRHLLVAVLVVPLVTAAIPGRSGLAFHSQRAWFDSLRILALPVLGGVRVHHLMLAGGVVTALATLWQEVSPVLQRPRGRAGSVPAELLEALRALPGWEQCAAALIESDQIVLATHGWPSRPHLLLSRGVFTRLTDPERAAALRHESAHWIEGRWLKTHALFLARLVQLHNPVALWCFRAYALEVEVDCDARAVTGHDPRELASALLKIYEQTERGDAAGRSALRWRVGVLLGDVPRTDDGLPVFAQIAAGVVMLVVLPWLV